MAWHEPVAVVEGHTFEIDLPRGFERAVLAEAFDTHARMRRDIRQGVITTLEQLRQVPLPPSCRLSVYPVPTPQHAHMIVE